MKEYAAHVVKQMHWTLVPLASMNVNAPPWAEAAILAVRSSREINRRVPTKTYVRTAWNLSGLP